MNQFWKRSLISVAFAGAAVWGGWRLADGNYGFAMLAGSVAGLAILYYLCRLPVDFLVLGAVLVGYLVGNRGFAQLSVFPELPVLPAEATLAFAGAWLVVKCALERRLPFRLEALPLALIALFVVSISRLAFDLREHRYLAIRDFATIYYAAFFFIVHAESDNERVRRFLRLCLLGGVLAIPGVFVLHETFPAFFHTQLVFRGTPLIFIKSDVALPMAAAGIYLMHFDPLTRQKRWAQVIATLLVLFVFACNSRAAQAGVFIVDLVLLFRRSWVPWLHFGALAVAALALASLAFSGHVPWAERKLQTSVERVMSIADFSGTMQYQSEDLGDKADNNRFRLAWWRSVAEETVATNPAFGLGFGHDLSRRFVAEYEGSLGEDFSARSPHNIVFTLFGRLGAAGLLLTVAIAGSMLQDAFRSRGDPERAGLWCMAWVVLIAACFGVVLENPMGAMPFWCVVGLAYAGAAVRRPTRAESLQPAAIDSVDAAESPGVARRS